MRARIVMLLLLLVAATVIAEPQPRQATAVQASANGKIVFVKGDPATNTSELFMIEPDGNGEPIQLTRTTEFSEAQPAWSPDGKRIVFIRHRTERNADRELESHLAVLELADGDVYQITPDNSSPVTGGYMDPAWSPGGSYVVMSFAGELSYNAVWGRGGRTLTSAYPAYAEEPGWEPEPHFEKASAPSWSPDGRDIAFQGKPEDEPSDIFIIDRWGKNLRRMELDGYQGEPEWSPDGSRLLFGEQEGWWTAARDGSDRRAVVSDARDAHWSPDGSKIVFWRDHGYDGPPEILIVDSDGSDLTYVAEGRQPSWQPLSTGRCTLIGTPGDDVFFTTPFDDVICLGDGDDRVVGRSGNDTIYAGAGADDVQGQAGNDLLHGGSGDDQIRAGSGGDLVLGKGGVDWLKGDRGKDEVRGNGDNDYLWGGYGRDLLRGGAGRDWCNSHHTDRRWSCERG